MFIKCFICPTELVTLSEYQRHIRLNHNLEEESYFPCMQNGCIRNYGTAKSLYNHLRRDHDLNGGDFSAVPLSENVTLVESSEESETEEPSFDLFTEEKKEFNLEELRYILNLFQMNNLNRSNVLDIIYANKNLAEMQGLPRPFSNLDTEYLIIKALKSLSLWIDPVDVVINYTDKYIQRDGSQAIVSKAANISVIPLTSSFKFHFKNLSTLNEAHKYMSTRSTLITDVKDVQFFDSYTFPYVIYYDEIEVGNALGSHKGVNKLGMFYVSLRCMHPKEYSKLKNILIYTCVPSSLRDKKSIDKILEYLVVEINALYIEGLALHGRTVKFKMLGLVGDNLGQHQILGFTESFSANFWCIRCKNHRDVIRKMSALDNGTLRTETNYRDDLESGDLSSTGIARDCIFNQIKGYHVTNNIIFDIMHDLHEGVCDIGMSKVLGKLCELPNIDLDIINCRIQGFQFGSHANRPMPITADKILKGKLGMSASEMSNMMKYFSLIVGDLVPHDNEIWGYYLLLQQILEILLKKYINRDAIVYLDKLINEHHSMWIEMFEPLKPKFHNMVHYSECLLRFGPLCHNWSMRFEAMHYKAKMYALSNKSRINICKSVILRHNFTVAYEELKKQTVPCPKLGEDFVKSIEVSGIEFKLKNLVAISVDTELPLFGFIKQILSHGNKHGFVITLIETTHVYPHMNAYVGKISNCGYKVVKVAECSFPLVYKVQKDIIFISKFDM